MMMMMMMMYTVDDADTVEKWAADDRRTTHPPRAEASGRYVHLSTTVSHQQNWRRKVQRKLRSVSLTWKHWDVCRLDIVDNVCWSAEHEMNRRWYMGVVNQPVYLSCNTVFDICDVVAEKGCVLYTWTSILPLNGSQKYLCIIHKCLLQSRLYDRRDDVWQLVSECRWQ